MGEFNRSSNGGGSGRTGLSPNASFRRRSSTVNPESDSQTRFNYSSSPHQSRRQSTVFRTRSPSDPQNYMEDPPRLSRRYSQPSSYQGVYADHPSPSLVRQERKTYSSLNHLPEVRTYLQFMEDSTVLPQRSKSFNGRNSSRRSSYNRRRPRSRPRTPILVGDESDYPMLHRVGSGSSSHYGVYLTPRTASLEQSGPNDLDYDQGNDADVEDGDEPSKKGKSQGQLGQYNAMVMERMSAATASLYNDCFTTQRRSSIRTTFI